jgi:hypothetical protein
MHFVWLFRLNGERGAGVREGVITRFWLPEGSITQDYIS